MTQLYAGPTTDFLEQATPEPDRGNAAGDVPRRAGFRANCSQSRSRTNSRIAPCNASVT